MSCADVQTIQAGNGAKTQFSFDFPYIFKSEIHVYFWNATTKEWDEKLTTDATYPWQVTDANPTIVEFTGTAPPAPAVPVDPGEPTVDNVRIRRITNIDDIRALFNPGSAIRSDDLNRNFEQLRYAIQEANCQGIPDDVDQYLKDYYWDRFDNTLYSTETWRSDDATIVTTAAADARFVDALNAETIGGVKTFSDSPVVPTPTANTQAANKVYVDTTAVTLIDAAITGNIGTDGTGITVTDDGDGTITLGIAANSVDLDRIKNDDLITQAEQDAGVAASDNNLFTALAAARRFDTFVQTTTPIGSDWEVGKTWLQNDPDKTLSVWDGAAWVGVSSGGTFTSQTTVVYVDAVNGDDANDGHRISRPKQTIKAAINQINSEIDITLEDGGSGYVTGSYTNVPLTGGTGTGLQANITVNGSGVVTEVTLTNASVLVDSYTIGETLSADAANLGGTGSGLVVKTIGTGDGQVVVVAPGIYQEAAPIQIKRRDVSIIGQALRSCIIHPTVATEESTLFEVNSGSFLQNLTFTGIKASGARGGNALDTDATYGLPTNQGWNVAFYNNAFIIKSPYIQNCTNFSDSEIDNSDLNAHRPAGGSAGDIDSAVTGGGLLIDGSTVHTNSPLRSMVCDSYTHVGLDGPGIFITNNGYCQATSSYAFFCHYHIKCLNGGQANLAASTTDFGRYALIADGKSPTAIFTATTTADAADQDITFTIDAPTADASWYGSATRPQGNMLVEIGGNIYPVLSATANGTGWDVTISRPNPSNRSENLGLDGAVLTGAAVSFYLRSMIASSGHTMEYVGSGTNYSALPENGGVPVDANQLVELNNGKVWTAITDHNGKFKVGDFFEVDQRTGFINFSAGSYAFDVVTDTTPELGGQLDALNNKIVNLADPTSAQDAATKAYVDTANAAQDTAIAAKLPLAGGTMTGALTLAADPTTNLEAATKQYVDASLSGVSADKIEEGNTSAEVIDTGSDGRFVVTTEGVEALRVDANGRLGVGTASPQADIQAGNADGSDRSLVLHSENNGTARIRFREGGTVSSGYNEYSFGMVGSSNAMSFELAGVGEAARIDSSGRLLVGTSSGSGAALVQVQGTASGSTGAGELYLKRGVAASSGSIGSGGGIGYISFTDSGSNQFAYIGCEADATAGTNDYPGRLVFATTADGASSSTERMRITNDGTTYTRGSTSVFSFASNAGAGTTNWLQLGGHSAASITGYTISYAVYTNGNVVNTNNSYGAISDIKLKENIVDASSQWDDIKALRPVNYNFKEGQTHTQIGLVAQEVELVSPGLVSESPDRDEDGNDLGTVTKSVNYSVLYMKAVKALQEAMERIEQLETEMAEVKAQLS